MRTVKAKCNQLLKLGRQGENLATLVEFDLSPWVQSYGDGNAVLIYQRNEGSVPVPCVTTQAGDKLTWNVTDYDTTYAGYGACELRYYVAGQLVKSAAWRTWVADALGPDEPVSPPPPWVDVVLAAATAAESWAVGGTGTRPGEDENNAKYWAEQAAGGGGSYKLPQATASELGGVKAGPATPLDTQSVHITDAGELVTAPTGGGGGGVSKEYVDAQDAAERAYATGLSVAAVCEDEAASATSTPNVWYVPKTMPRPNGTAGMMIDVFWVNGHTGGLGYNVSLVWGEPGGADNETVISQASVTDSLTGEVSIPTEGTVRYQLINRSDRLVWKYVSGDLLVRQYSTDAASADADKPVHGLEKEYLPGMVIYVQLDKGNSSPLMRLVPDAGPTLPVYGNGAGTETGALPAGYICHLVNAEDHWQLINSPGDGGSYTLPQATATELGGVKAAPATSSDTQAVRIRPDGTLVTAPGGGGGGGAVDSVNGQTGAVVLTAANVGAIPAAEKAAVNGVATLGSDGKIPAGQLPDMDYVPTSRTINGKPLTGNVTLTAADVGASDPTELAEAVHTTMNVEFEDDGFGGYVTIEYNDDDINNHRNAGGLVQAKYYDAEKRQTYTYYYSTMESDRKPTFIRTYIEGGKIIQVLASVGNDKTVTLERRTADTVTAQQLADAIGALGTVFDYKGSKPSKSDLPADGNTVGDVWYVVDESTGYVWIDQDGGKWEPFGPTIDLTGYATTEALTEGLAKKQDAGDYATVEALAQGLATKQDTGDYATNTALTEGLTAKLDVDKVGQPNGVAPLDADSKVPLANLPEMSPAFSPILRVTVDTGAEVTATDGVKTVTGTSEAGVCELAVPNFGQWTVQASLGGETSGKQIVDVSEIKVYNVELAFVTVYGARWDGSASTKWERTDAASGFVDPVPAIKNGEGSSPFDALMPWSGMVKEARTAGMMVKIPKYWVKVQPWGSGGLWVQIADGPKAGFVVSPAHQDRGDGKGERDAVYVARYKINNSWKSQSGAAPKVNVTSPNAYNGIHGLGANIWMWDWAMHWTIKFLYLVEFADWNSQKVIGKGCGNNSAVQGMGYTDGMKYHTGTTQNNRDTYGLGTQYRYIEGLWDNAYDWIGGCYYNGSGLSVVMNPASFTPGQQSGGTLIGTVASGWPSKFKVGGLPWAIVPTATNGSETSYMSDSWNFNASNPCLFVGGYYFQDGSFGLFCVSRNGASYASGSISARSMELP